MTHFVPGDVDRPVTVTCCFDDEVEVVRIFEHAGYTSTLRSPVDDVLVSLVFETHVAAVLEDGKTYVRREGDW